MGKEKPRTIPDSSNLSHKLEVSLI